MGNATHEQLCLFGRTAAEALCVTEETWEGPLLADVLTTGDHTRPVKHTQTAFA